MTRSYGFGGLGGTVGFMVLQCLRFFCYGLIWYSATGRFLGCFRLSGCFRVLGFRLGLCWVVFMVGVEVRVCVWNLSGLARSEAGVCELSLHGWRF